MIKNKKILVLAISLIIIILAFYLLSNKPTVNEGFNPQFIYYASVNDMRKAADDIVVSNHIKKIETKDLNAGKGLDGNPLILAFDIYEVEVKDSIKSHFDKESKINIAVLAGEHGKDANKLFNLSDTTFVLYLKSYPDNYPALLNQQQTLFGINSKGEIIYTDTVNKSENHLFMEKVEAELKSFIK